VEVEGVGDGTALVANKIRFTQNDLKTAETVESRVTPVEGRLGTAESRVGSAENRLSASEENAKKMSGQISELDAISNAAKGGAKAAQEAADSAMAGVSTTNERITSLDDYDTVHTASIRFKAGSAVLSDEAKKTLNDVAEQAKQRKGFVIEIAGFASAEGSKDFNMRLSNERAHAAAQYLAVEHDIPLRRIITPLGYGVTHAVADNKTRDGRKENRRTEVKILVSKGLMTTPSSQKPTSGGDSPNQ
jgi:OOP family OmpA-OmpF porin